MPHHYLVQRLKTFFVYRVLHVDDTPHRIALGVAAGIFVTWTPTIGLQMLLTLALSILLRANKFVGVPFVWISNPFTFGPIYLPAYLLGGLLLGGRYAPQAFHDAVAQAAACDGSWWACVQAWFDALWPIYPALWVGGVLAGGVCAVIAYVVVYRAVVVFRRFRARRGAPEEGPAE